MYYGQCGIDRFDGRNLTICPPRGIFTTCLSSGFSGKSKKHREKSAGKIDGQRAACYNFVIMCQKSVCVMQKDNRDFRHINGGHMAVDRAGVK